MCECLLGFDISTNCTDCLANIYGYNCSKNCPSCNVGHSHCLSGINGSGQCVCNANYNSSTNCSTCNSGWNSTTNCITCSSGYYGPSCTQCALNCNGACHDGLNGNGQCITSQSQASHSKTSHSQTHSGTSKISHSKTHSGTSKRTQANSIIIGATIGVWIYILFAL